MSFSTDKLQNVKGKNILITGVSGIGNAFAKLCLEKGANKVYVVDRDGGALEALGNHPNLKKINADVGKKEGPKTIAAEVGNDTLHWTILGAACPKNINGMGHNLKTIGRDEMDDMMNTELCGKLFVVQALQANLKAAQFKDGLLTGDDAPKPEDAQPKARVFCIGAPFGDGPKPDGTYMVVPGWGGEGAAKAASKWIQEGMKAEMGDIALFGYGHPGVTKTSITGAMVKDYDPSHMLNKMVSARFEKGDFHTPEETAAMFYSAMSQTGDEEYVKETWNIVKNYARFGKELGVKETSDVSGGIVLPK